MKKRIWLWCLIAGAICLLAAATDFLIKSSDRSSDSRSSSAYISVDPQKDITLDFYIWDDEQTYVQSVIDTYCSQHPSVYINLHVINRDDYNDDIADILSSHAKIDLLGIRSTSRLVQFVDRQQLMDLSPYIKSNDMDITAYGSMFNNITVDNKCFGMPTRCTCWVLYYNKDIFDAAHIEYPKQMTWEEYRDLAKALTKGEGVDKIYGGYWETWCSNFLALQHSSYLIDDDLSYTRKSLELLNTFYNIDQSHISYRQMVDQKIDYCTAFEKGNIAMIPQGEWLINMLIRDLKKGITDIRWDIAPMPVSDGQEAGVTWGQYQYVGIPAKSKYPEEAFDFIQFLCGEEGAKIYAQNGILHAYSNNEIKQIYQDVVGKDSVSIFFQTKKIQEQLAMSGYEDILQAFNTCAKEYYLGNKTLDETMSDFNTQRNEILNH